ncbi:multi-tm2 domain protein [Paenibacillus sp. PK3_47]|uniref:multi-tm2 domain protein n=1 Tax=Paenibacillus sp. PK3_47 TaxID=2072642 RepID=UPI00201DBD23|nr:multi-tm2 domain protein [Paenibacillus sp. PK3_47]
MQHNRSKMMAFLLNMIPGLGHYYYRSRVKGFIYGFIFFGLAGFGFILGVDGEEDVALFFLFMAAVLWMISMFDMVIKLLREPDVPAHYPQYPYYPHYHSQMPGQPEGTFEPPFGYPPPESYVYPEQGRGQGRDSERFYTILLSFVPGLGHLHLGLLQRGLSFLIGFFGLAVMLFFVAAISGREIFLVFLLLLPVMWLYCMFDAVQHVSRKQAGEMLEDKTLFEQLEHGRSTGQRSKVFATLLAAFPGAGHMYLGLQKRGLQLMLIFLGSIYILDLMNLSLFLFLIPVIWFYSFFDGLQQSSKYGKEVLYDKPVIESWTRYQGWVGFALLFLGVYYILIRLVLPEFGGQFYYVIHQVQSNMNTIVVSLLLIGGGIHLLLKSRKKNHDGEAFLRDLERKAEAPNFRDPLK